MKWLFLILPIIANADVLPDAKLTPGAIREVSITELCTTSTKLVRHTSQAVKNKVYYKYNQKPVNDPVCTGVHHSCFEIDHLISLELGGADTQENLWPQLYDGPWNAHDKDKLENELHRRVCKQGLSLTTAQQCISTNWIECYKDIFK